MRALTMDELSFVSGGVTVTEQRRAPLPNGNWTVAYCNGECGNLIMDKFAELEQFVSDTVDFVCSEPGKIYSVVVATVAGENAGKAVGSVAGGLAGGTVGAAAGSVAGGGLGAVVGGPPGAAGGAIIGGLGGRQSGGRLGSAAGAQIGGKSGGTVAGALTGAALIRYCPK